MKRARHFRVVRIELECGHTADLNTSRYRVSKDLAACLFGDAVRRGAYCKTCYLQKGYGGRCQPTKFVGVFRE